MTSGFFSSGLEVGWEAGAELVVGPLVGWLVAGSAGCVVAGSSSLRGANGFFTSFRRGTAISRSVLA